MKFKNYQILKVQNYLKTNSLLLLSHGTNQKAFNWIKLEQNLKTINLKYYKLYNKITRKIFKISIFSNFINLINGPFFFLTLTNKTTALLPKKLITKELLEFLKFKLLALKFNKKIYSVKQIQKLNSFVYKQTISVFYQFLLINLKLSQTLVISKQCDLNT